MTCRFCSYGFCPYCRAALPTAHSGHRHSFEDHRRAQQSGPISSDAVDRSPTKGDSTDEIARSLRVNVVSHHAPSITGERVTDAQDVVPKISAFVSE